MNTCRSGEGEPHSCMEASQQEASEDHAPQDMYCQCVLA